MVRAPHRHLLVPGPSKWRGLRVGLLGGSFNPAHEGHLNISRQALGILKLDFVWWLVAPQNPLKNEQELAPFKARLTGAKQLAKHSKIEVSSPEQYLGTNYSHEVVAAIQKTCPHTRFVWLMGADNMVQFPAWRNWKHICQMVPIAVFDRPGYSLKALSGEMAKCFAEYRLSAQQASSLAEVDPPAWLFIKGQPHPQSATNVRKERATKAKQRAGPDPATTKRSRIC